MGSLAMMSDHAWIIFIMLAFSAFFIVAGFTVKTFRYKYGGLKVPRLVGGIVYVSVGMFFLWAAIKLALKP